MMQPTLLHSKLLTQLTAYVASALKEFDQIPAARKEELWALTRYVQKKVAASQSVQLTFICTHNSRRSHLSQLWAQVAAYYFGVPGVQTYSGGTEATAFNPRAVRAIEEAGFKVEKTGEEPNPVYLVQYTENNPPVSAFSKIYDEGGNPTTDFGAVMTCTHADENCPFIPGAVRISLPFERIPKHLTGLRRKRLNTPSGAGRLPASCFMHSAR